MVERDDMLAMVASLYYKLHLSQADIAARLGVSSSTVSRLLKEAWDRGIIEVQVHSPIPRDFALEQELLTRFHLNDAYVLESAPDADDASLLAAMGQLAATFLQRALATINPGGTIGVAWGTGVHATVSALPNNPSNKIDVVQLLGGVGALVVDSPDLARMVAVKLGGRHYDLHAPVIVERPDVREIFLKEPAVHEGILRAQSVRLAITGIGAVDEKSSSFLRAGLLTRSDLAQLRGAGAVGEMVGHFFDCQGRTEGIEINQRVIGVELTDLRQMPQVLAVARGLAKAPSIHGALRGEYLTVLATDDITARVVLQIDRQRTGQWAFPARSAKMPGMQPISYTIRQTGPADAGAVAYRNAASNAAGATAVVMTAHAGRAVEIKLVTAFPNRTTQALDRSLGSSDLCLQMVLPLESAPPSTTQS